MTETCSNCINTKDGGYSPECCGCRECSWISGDENKFTPKNLWVAFLYDLRARSLSYLYRASEKNRNAGILTKWWYLFLISSWTVPLVWTFYKLNEIEKLDKMLSILDNKEGADVCNNGQDRDV